MPNRFINIITLILILAVSAFGTTWYIETDGSDANTGKSWAQSCATTSFLNDSLSHGDTAFFGSGDWIASQILPPTGTSEPKTLYACSTYSLETAHDATIYSGDSLGSWTLHSGNVYKANWTPSAEDEDFSNGPNYPCVIGGDSIYSPRLSIEDVTNVGYFYYNYTDDILYIYPYITGDPDTSGHRILASAIRGAVFLSGETRYTEFFGLDLKNGFGGAVVFESHAVKQSLNSFIHCNIAHSNTKTGGNSAAIYMGAYGDSTAEDTLDGYGYGNVFRACTVYSAVSNINQEGTTHAGAGITFYGMRQTIVDSCYFYLLPGAGVMWKGGGQDYYGNRVSFSTFDGTDSMPFGKATFTKAGVEHACGADRDSVYGCIFKNIISYSPVRASAFGILEGDCNWGNSRYFAGDFFCNNTLYNCELFWVGHCEDPEAGFEKITFKYNVSEKVVREASQWIRSSATATIIDNTSYCEVDSNYWYDGSESFLFYDSTGTNRNWAYWTGTIGYDANGYNSDPGLNDPANDDFTRPEASGEMNHTYGGRTWTIFGAIQEVDSLIQDLTATDTTQTTIDVRNDYTLIGITVDTSVYQWSINNFSSLVGADTIANPPDPDTVQITGLDPNTTYQIRAISWDDSTGITDTSATLEVQTESSEGRHKYIRNRLLNILRRVER